MFIAMKNCVSPYGHDWQAFSFTTRAGSTPVKCVREGCDEIGFRLEEEVAQNQGRSQ